MACESSFRSQRHRWERNVSETPFRNNIFETVIFKTNTPKQSLGMKATELLVKDKNL
jgi:hypothetical protein